MKQLKHTGKGYNGIDPATQAFVRVRSGDIITVSDEKAAQLLADFPDEWLALDDTVATTQSDSERITKPARPNRRKPRS